MERCSRDNLMFHGSLPMLKDECTKELLGPSSASIRRAGDRNGDRRGVSWRFLHSIRGRAG